MSNARKPELLHDAELEHAVGGYQIELAKVRVTSYQVSGAAGDDADIGAEELTIVHEFIERVA